MGIIESIPASWRRVLKLQDNTKGLLDKEGNYKLVDRLLYCKQPTKLIYDIKINNKSKRPEKAQTKWKMELGMPSGKEIL